MTEDEIFDITVAVLEEPNQRECAEMLAQDHPSVTKADLLKVIDEVEPDLIRHGAGNLSTLRAELARVHPAWRETA